MKSLCASITDFGYFLMEKGIALDAQPHILQEISGGRTSLRWVRNRSERLMIDMPSNVDCYLALIKRKDFSYLMSDGGVVQIAYIYDGKRIKSHRLLYHPCPFPITKDDMSEFTGGLVDFIDGTFMSDVKQHLLLRSPVRFDYAPDTAADFHPASHLTLNGPDCRIPVRSPLKIGAFIEFVLQNFYLHAWQRLYVDTRGRDKVSRMHQIRQEDEECLSAHDRRRVYLNWESARRPPKRIHQEAPRVSRR